MSTVHLTVLGLLSFLAISNVDCLAQEDESKVSEVAEKRYALFANQAAAFELKTKRGDRKLQLREQPLQKFSTGGDTFGSVFLWKADDGRPGMIGTIGCLPINGVDFGFTELHWLLDEPLSDLVVGKAYPKQWAAAGEELAPKPIPTGLDPAQTSTARLAQMRGLARNFSANMTENKNRNELRLLPQPLYRYDDPTLEKDGAIFAYVWTIGTDPELLIHIQTRKENGQFKWFYQPLRFTWRQLELSYEGTEVWKAEELLRRNDLLQNGPYITTLTEALR